MDEPPGPPWSQRTTGAFSESTWRDREAVTTQSTEAVQYTQAHVGKSSVFPSLDYTSQTPVILLTTSQVLPLFCSFEIVFASYPGVYFTPLSEFSPIVRNSQKACWRQKLCLCMSLGTSTLPGTRSQSFRRLNFRGTLPFDQHIPQEAQRIHRSQWQFTPFTGLSDLIHSEGVPRDNSHFIQHKDTEKHSTHANSNETLNIRRICAGDAPGGLGCCSSVNVITLNHRGVLSSFIQSTPAEHLLWVGQYGRRYVAEGKERRKLLVLVELTSTFSWGIF